MRNVIKLTFILVVTICSYSFSSKNSTQLNNLHLNNTDTTSRPPEFKDDGKTVASLMKAYNCEAIEYENWGDDDATDSSLTICLINSNKVPTGDQSDSQLKDIALQIKKAVKHPEMYRSYYIIFVKRENHSGTIFSSHTTGSNILSKEL